MSRLGRTIPALPVGDMARSTEFYRARLGFSVVHADEALAIVQRDDAALHLWAATDETWRERFDPNRPIDSGAESFIAGTASCRIEVEGVHELFAEYRDQRVLHRVSVAVEEQPWGTLEFAAVDVDNNLLTFFERGARADGSRLG